MECIQDGWASLISQETLVTKLLESTVYFTWATPKKEIELGVAKGFPQVALNENQTIVSYEFLKFFEFDYKNLRPYDELHDENLKLNLTFDLLTLLLSGDQK